MLATTWLQSESQEPCLRRRSSMPGNFTSHPKSLEESSKIIMENLLDKLALEIHFDLSQHPAHKSINLPKHYVFNNASKFRRVVAADGARVLHLLVYMVKFNINTNKKVAKNYAKWERINRERNKALRVAAKNFADAKKKLHQSQKEFTNMQKKLERLQRELESAKA